MKKKISISVYFLLSVIALIMVLNSCITEKKRAKICATCPVKESSNDSTASHEQISTFDTTAWIKNHVGKDQEFYGCDSLLAALSRSNNLLVTDSNGVKSTITKKGKSITFRCETDSLKAEIKGLKKTISNFHSKNTVKTFTIKEDCKRDHRTDFDGLCRWFFYIVAPMIGIYLFLRIKKLVP